MTEGPHFSPLSFERTFGPQREFDTRLTFTYSPDRTERIARDLRGRFTSAQQEMGPAMERLAIELQETQAQMLRDAVADTGREQRGTHYLEDAILSPSNRRSSADGFVVGIASAFEESPAAPYWRGLEEGTSVHVGQRIYGLWVTPHGFAPPMEGARDAIGARGWRNIPEDIRDEYRVGGRLPGFQIRRPIIGYHYLERGRRTFVESGAIRRVLSEAVAAAIARQGRSL